MIILMSEGVTGILKHLDTVAVDKIWFIVSGGVSLSLSLSLSLVLIILISS